MTAPDRQRIAHSFGAADAYDHHAGVQRDVARRLAEDIANAALPDAPRVLEIGCGTGFLTEALADKAIGGEWLVTDLSHAMVARAARRMAGRAETRFAVLDGENGLPEAAGQYDLVCSSLALQWFFDPAAAAARMLGWLAPGGHLMFTTLGQGTFAEWRAAHAAEGQACGLRQLLAPAFWDSILPERRARPARVDLVRAKHADGLDFLRSLRAIGAATPDPGHAPLGASAMRRVLRRFEAGGAAVSYEVITCHYRRQS